MEKLAEDRATWGIRRISKATWLIDSGLFKKYNPFPAKLTLRRSRNAVKETVMTELVSPANLDIEARNGLSGFASALFIILALLFVQCMNAQTFTVLHNFTGGVDGANPFAGLTPDAGGNFYGTTGFGGRGGAGTVLKLTHQNSAWILTTLYSFSRTDGYVPIARVVFGPGGALYGTTESGGENGDGTVFKLQPLGHNCPTTSCQWTETILHNFTGDPDGAAPASGDIVFDSSGNLYGATLSGGTSGPTCADDSPCGTAYELARGQNGWSEAVIWNFEGGGDGAFPNGVIIDNSGNLYGTTNFRGANSYGTVFSLVPNGHGGWTESTLYSFSGGADGGGPRAGVISDGSGGFLGSTSYGGSGNGGTVFQLSSSGGNWLLNPLSSFNYSGTLGLTPPGPGASLVMDANGNLYGTTALAGAFSQGSVFKLTPSNGGWTLTTLHDFTGGADGGQPLGQLVLDASGNIFGTASVGGSSVGNCNQGLGCGVIFEMAP
jgi:uncharacterized repeat protein (TIGR03803 family)